jgi:hypothetical protein
MLAAVLILPFMSAEFGQKWVKSITELNAAILAPTLAAADIPMVVDFFAM